jgi:aerobic C4-dicarboxylate transport protein
MSEARALTNFTGNAVATLLVGTWTKELDREQLTAVLAGERPFDETTMSADDHLGADEQAEVAREHGTPAAAAAARDERPSTASIAAIVGPLEEPTAPTRR